MLRRPAWWADAAPLKALARFRRIKAVAESLGLQLVLKRMCVMPHQSNLPKSLWARGEEPNLANMPEWGEAYGCTIHQASGLRAWAGSHIERRTSSLRGPTPKRFAPHSGSSSKSGFSCPKDWGNRLNLASARGLGFQISEGASSASFDGAFFASSAVILKVASGHRHYCQWRNSRSGD